MIVVGTLCEQFKGKMANLPVKDKYGKSDLVIPDFLVGKEKDIEIYYAPLDYVNTGAKVVIVGITPGWQQMEIAYRFGIEGLHKGMSCIEACQYAKSHAMFAGAMRKNIIEMFDELGMPEKLGIENSGTLFQEHSGLLHSTSAIRYPVFVKGKNYTGHTPALLTSPILRNYAMELLSQELSMVKNAYIVPLGKTVSSVLEELIKGGMIKEEQCLLGFPHPSGANGHRKKQFVSLKVEMKKKIEGFSKINPV